MIQTKKYTTILAITASIVLIVSLVTFFSNKIEKEPTAKELGTFKNPEEAFVETQKALNLISENLNTGMKSVQHLEEYEKTKNKIFKKQ